MENQAFADSAMFERTFDEGMALVEETARYLDGVGREEARFLPRKAAMLYAGESPRFILRRLLILSGEDIGLADPMGLVVANAAAQASG